MHLPSAALLLPLAAAASGQAQERFTEPKRWEVPCSTHYAERGFIEGCHPQRCGRAIQDGFVGAEDLARLKAIADRAMASQPQRAGGPTIADINRYVMLRKRGVLRFAATRKHRPMSVCPKC